VHTSRRNFLTGAAGVIAGSTARRQLKANAGDWLELRVMTFNVRNESQDTGANAWAKRRPLVAQVIGSFKPDVVGMQESSGDNQLRDLDSSLEGLRLVNIEGQGQGRRNSILYRAGRFDVSSAGIFWYSNTPDTFSTHWGNSYPRSCTWVRFVEKGSGRAFYHFNTHLDHISENSRLRSIQMLTSRIASRKNKDPFVVTGDFNSHESSAVVKYLKGGTVQDVDAVEIPGNPVPFVDSFRVARPDATDVGTSHPFSGKTSGRKIDYVFAQGSFQVLSADIVTTNDNGFYPSDHFPVTAVLRFFK
jgi:endonuclease/exonuclease/phosphatase family metal-dependent hydrolase